MMCPCNVSIRLQQRINDAENKGSEEGSQSELDKATQHAGDTTRGEQNPGSTPEPSHRPVDF